MTKEDLSELNKLSREITALSEHLEKIDACINRHLDIRVESIGYINGGFSFNSTLVDLNIIVSGYRDVVLKAIEDKENEFSNIKIKY